MSAGHAGGAAGEASYSYAAVDGFQVVLLVESEDEDNVLFPLSEQGHAKSLLPIANVPLLGHQLRAFHSVGFADVIVVCEEAAKKSVQMVASQYVPSVQCNIVSVDAGASTNSIEMLKAARQHILPSSEVIVVGGDIVTDAAITEMLDLHRLRCAAMTMLAIPRAFQAGENKKKPKYTDLIGLDSSVHWGSIRDADQAQQRILYLANANELEDQCSVRASMMRHCPNIRIHSNLVDANIYIFANWVLELLDNERCSGYNSIKNQFASYLVRQQHRSSGTEAIPESASKRWEEYHQIQSMSPQLPRTSTMKCSSSPDVVQCYALVPGDCFGMRLDSVDNFVEMNKHVAHERAVGNSFWPKTSPEELPHNTNGNKKAFDADTLVGEGCEFQERTTVKKSVLGKNCKIGTQCKIANCIILDDVVIGDGVKLENCIICTGVKLGEKSNLTRCRIGYNEDIAADSVMKDEIFPMLEL